jgi:hypothetical protein
MAADALVTAYWTIPVHALPPDGRAFSAVVSCNSYLMNVGHGDTSPSAERVRARQGEVDRVMAEARRRRVPMPSSDAIARTRYGKGLPSDLQGVLVAGVAAGALPTEARALQRWADANLGVDCTGFASAYFVSVGHMSTRHVTNAGAGYFYTRAGQLRDVVAPGTPVEVASVDDVRADDVILWMFPGGRQETRRPGHIAVVYGRTRDALLCAESSGASDGRGHSGPRLSEKRLTLVDAARPGFFRVGPRDDDRVIVIRPFNAVAPVW